MSYIFLSLLNQVENMNIIYLKFFLSISDSNQVFIYVFYLLIIVVKDNCVNIFDELGFFESD